MLLGAHVSTAGGLQKSPMRGVQLGCQSIQIFTRNQRQWKTKPLSGAEAKAFRQELVQSDIQVVAVHASYLLNLGSPVGAALVRSRKAFCQELGRCEQLGIRYLIVHPGAHLGSGEKVGLQTIADSLNQTLNEKPQCRTQILLETTAGQGSQLGYRFEQLAEILGWLNQPDRVAVCVDTCHIFAAGYELRTRRGYRQTLRLLDRIVGLHKVKVFHLNDSRRGLGSRVDRHEHIGQGYIGLEAFRSLVNEKRFSQVPMILETPGGESHYGRNLRLLRRLRQSQRRSR